MANSDRSGGSGKPRRVPGGTASRKRDLEGALHDVGNELTVVLGWLDAASRQLGHHPSVAEALRMAMERARQGRRIARSAIGDHDVWADRPIAADVLARQAAAGVQPRASLRSVRVLTELIGDVAAVELLSPSLALQVLTNLLLNAIQCSPQGADVILETAREDMSRVRLVVRDQGVGFAHEDQPHVFRGLRSTRRAGRGVGLQHAQRVASAAGGSLRLLSPSVGAALEVVWPARPASSSAHEARRLEGKRILILEDDAAVIGLLDMGLSARGARVTSACSAQELEARLRESGYDAVLVDVSPVANSLEATLVRIEQACPGIRVVITSGAPSAPSRIPLSHTLCWVRKPFEIDEIVFAIADGGNGERSKP